MYWTRGDGPDRTGQDRAGQTDRHTRRYARSRRKSTTQFTAGYTELYASHGHDDVRTRRTEHSPADTHSPELTPLPSVTAAASRRRSSRTSLRGALRRRETRLARETSTEQTVTRTVSVKLAELQKSAAGFPAVGERVSRGCRQWRGQPVS